MRFPTIGDQHVYADDAVSGRDVLNLKERARLMADVDAGRIQIVIMADMSRFSRREGDEVVRELRQIARKAQVWFYESGSRYQADDSGAKIAAFANAVINNDYPRKIAIKTLAAQKMKAGLGYVMGGRTFGYRNVDVLTGQTDGSGRPIRSHVTRMTALRFFLRVLSLGWLAAFIPWLTLILLNAPILAPGGTLAPLLRFQPYNASYESMLTAIHIVWAVMLWRASYDPARHALFIDFSIWANAGRLRRPDPLDSPP